MLASFFSFLAPEVSVSSQQDNDLEAMRFRAVNVISSGR
jgi:hypothetical protein